MTEQVFNLDLIPDGIPPIVHVSQYDKGQIWKFNIIQNNTLFTIPQNSSVTVQGTKKDGTGFQYGCTYSGSQVIVKEEQQMTVYYGDVKAEIAIANGDDLIATLNFIIRIEPAPLNEDTIISETMLPLIEEAAELAERIPEVVGYMETSEAYAVGTRNGVPVTSGDPAYQNNAKYYADNFVGAITDAQWAAIQAILV